MGSDCPAWDELMDRLERGVSGGFIVFDLERFTRQSKDGERMTELAAHGLGVLDSESEYDLRTPNGKKAFRDAINAAAHYSDRLSSRARRGKRLKALSGEPNSTTRPFGFEDDFVTVREAEYEYENATPGEHSALLRREGLHYTNISSWRRKRVG